MKICGFCGKEFSYNDPDLVALWITHKGGAFGPIKYNYRRKKVEIAHDGSCAAQVEHKFSKISDEINRSGKGPSYVTSIWLNGPYGLNNGKNKPVVEYIICKYFPDFEIYDPKRNANPHSKRFNIFKRDGYRCQICGVSAKDGEHVRLEIDHIVPRSKGGSDHDSNKWILCFECNQGKNTKDL